MGRVRIRSLSVAAGALCLAGCGATIGTTLGGASGGLGTGVGSAVGEGGGGRGVRGHFTPADHRPGRGAA